jgi:hypothetical protein
MRARRVSCSHRIMTHETKRQMLLHHLEAASAYAEEIGDTRVRDAVEQVRQSLSAIPVKRDRNGDAGQRLSVIAAC